MLILKRGNLEKYRDILIMLLYISSEILLDKDIYGKTAYDYYVKSLHKNNIEKDHIFDEYHLKILK